MKSYSLNSRQLDTVFQVLHQKYPENKTELNYTTPFQLLIAVLMSAQTTDKQVNKITTSLFDTIQGPQDVLNLGEEKLTNAIRSINYFKTKAHHIYRSSEILLSQSYQQQVQDNLAPHLDYEMSRIYSTPEDIYHQYGYWISNTEALLTILPGVGVKTAKVVLHCLYGYPVIAVDTHVHRVANRLGLVHTKTPQETAKLIEQVVPQQYLTTAHHSLILFGRYQCTAKNPHCEECFFASFCKYFQMKTKKI